MNVKTNLKFFLTIAIITLLFGCKRENEDQNFINAQIERNEQEILSYISAKGLEMQKDPQGIYYKITGNPNGNSPDTTFRYVELKYEVRLIPNETPIDTNYKISGTRTLIAPIMNPTSGGSVIIPKGVDLFMQLGKNVIYKGQKATLLMNHTLAYGTSSTPFLPPYAAVRVDLEVVNVRAEEEYISDRMQSMGLVATQNEKGIIYSRVQLGTTQDFIRDSSVVTVKYIGRRVIENTIFDSGESFSFRPIGNVIQGWKIGIPLMKLGEKGYLFVPSKSAYGVTGSTNQQTGEVIIKPYAPLYFEIEVIKVDNEQ